MNITKICNRLLETSFYLLFFLVPLILTPFNYELFEFNKMLTVYLLTIIIITSWLIKMVASKKIICQRTFLDIPLCFFLFSQILATIFSIDRHTSWWGYYSRFNGGLLSTISYFLLYYAFVSNMSVSNLSHPRGGVAPAAHLGGVFNCIRYTLISATLVASYGIAEHFGIDAQYWVQDVQNRVFSTLGQPNWLAAYLVALIPITWALALNATHNLQHARRKYIHYLLFIILYSCLLFTRSRSGLLGFGIAFFVFWPLAFLTLRKKVLKPFLLVSCGVLLITFIAGRDWVPGMPAHRSLSEGGQSAIEETDQSQPQMLITESGDIRKVVWKGAVEIWRHHPFFGTGPETFAYSYYWYRPRKHNDLSEWDFLYNKAHNEYLNLAATTGTVGLASYLLLIGTFLGISMKYLVFSKKPLDTSSYILNTSLLAGYASILVTNFFGFSVVTVSLWFFLFPAISVVLAQKKKTEEKVEKVSLQLRQELAISLIVLVGMFLISQILKYWYADFHFARGEKFNQSNQHDLAFNSLQLAISARAQEPIYHDELAWAATHLAVSTSQQQNATLSAQLVQMAISEQDLALKISPYNLNFWKNRTKIFYQLSNLDQKYYQEAFNSLLQATSLAPTDPKIKYNLALFYAGNDQLETAIETLQETVTLKPNYEDARWALALFYEQLGQKDNARQQLKYILENINPQSQRAKERLP